MEKGGTYTFERSEARLDQLKAVAVDSADLPITADDVSSSDGDLSLDVDGRLSGIISDITNSVWL